MSARTKPTYVTAVLAALIALSVFAGRPGKAEDLPAAPVPDSELAEMRGGFIVADGIQFNFGAQLTATVNGQLAFQTQVTYTPNGPQVAQTVGANAVRASSTSTGTITGLNLQGFSPSQIALLNHGATALIQKVSGGSVQNIVINAASNQKILQTTQLQMSVANLPQVEQMFQHNLTMLNLLQNGQTGLTALH
jgi:hypothetical protein